MDKTKFINNLKNNHINLSEKQIQDFVFFLSYLLEENEKMNLTSITETKDIYEKHFYDSLTPFFKTTPPEGYGLDIGTGAGFPSIPLKIVFPKLKIIALDSVTKKVDFVSRVVDRLELEDLEISNERAEFFSNKKENIEKFDFVFSRATGPISIVMEISVKSLKVGGKLILWKSKNVDEDIKEAKSAASKLNLKLIEKQQTFLPVQMAERNNLIYVKTNKTPNLYPRDFTQIKKNPL